MTKWEALGGNVRVAEYLESEIMPLSSVAWRAGWEIFNLTRLLPEWIRKKQKWPVYQVWGGWDIVFPGKEADRKIENVKKQIGNLFPESSLTTSFYINKWPYIGLTLKPEKLGQVFRDIIGTLWHLEKIGSIPKS